MTFQAGAEAEAVILGECPGGDEDDRWQVASMSVADRLIELKRLGARQIDLLVWPKAKMNDFITFEKLRPQLRGATLEQVRYAMRLDEFPRGYFHNGRTMWRVVDIEKLIVRQRKST
jgi:hypothetical protein